LAQWIIFRFRVHLSRKSVSRRAMLQKRLPLTALASVLVPMGQLDSAEALALVQKRTSARKAHHLYMSGPST
jgi:hypothetical protein